MKKVVFIILVFAGFSTSHLYGQWSTTNLSSARFNIGIGSVDNKVFFAGSSPSTEAQVIDIYDLESKSWSSDELEVFRQFTFAEGIGDKMYFAGYTQTFSADQDIIEVYDAPTETWSTLEMPGIFGATSLTAVDDILVLVKGGEVRMYNTTTGVWIERSLSVSRILALAVGCNGKVTFAGGGSFVQGLYDIVDIYDVASDTWSTGSLSAEKNGMEGVCLQNKVYYVGGALGFSGDSFLIEIYDTESDTWSTMDMAQEKSNVGVAATANNLYIMGGRTGQSSADFQTEVELINGSTGERTIDNLSIKRSSISAFAVGNTVFAAGGFEPEESSYITTVDIFQEILSGVEVLEKEDYSVYPNPVTTNLRISKNGVINSDEIVFEIYNRVGERIESGVSQGRVELSHVEQGVYFIKLVNRNNKLIKFVKI